LPSLTLRVSISGVIQQALALAADRAMPLQLRLADSILKNLCYATGISAVRTIVPVRFFRGVLL
ncbi:MAG: hypothetical protein KDA96_06630, partial [Planctomycetaceae bacterium]|nr:hypothetical protein [Planctomycetaceae bacterium]